MVVKVLEVMAGAVVFTGLVVGILLFGVLWLESVWDKHR
jgi:hypothetical protein